MAPSVPAEVSSGEDGSASPVPPATRARLLETLVIRRALNSTDTRAPKTRGPIRTAPRVGGAVQKVAGPAYRTHGRPGHELQAAWADIVGETLAHMTRPDHYQPGKGAANNGILTIRVAGAFALDIQHLQPQIIERVNAHFGYRAIDRLKIVQGPLPEATRPLNPQRKKPISPAEQSALADQTKAVEDDRLRKALEALGRDILARAPGGG